MRRGLARIGATAAIVAGLTVYGKSGTAGASGSQQAGFSIQNTGEDLTVNFVAVSSGFPVGVSQYLWKFGDGTSEETAVPQVTHTYQRPGEYQASLTETGSSGGGPVAPAPTLTANATGTVLLVMCSTSPCTAQITRAKTIHLLVATGSPTSSPASIQLFAGTYQINPCLTTISPAVAISDSGFAPATNDLTVTLKYTTSLSSGASKTCFSSSVPFTNKKGKTVTSGLLPSCTASGGVSPCVQSVIQKSGSTTVTKQLIIPAGDPKVGAH